MRAAYLHCFRLPRWYGYGVLCLLSRFSRRKEEAFRQILNPKHLSRRQDSQPFYQIMQFSHIARPVIIRQKIKEILAHANLFIVAFIAGA